jgi:hypothetical protein
MRVGGKGGSKLARARLGSRPAPSANHRYVDDAFPMGLGLGLLKVGVPQARRAGSRASCRRPFFSESHTALAWTD